MGVGGELWSVILKSGFLLRYLLILHKQGTKVSCLRFNFMISPPHPPFYSERVSNSS